MRKPTIAIAGATGFIGRWFIDQYHDQYNIIGLSRSEIQENTNDSVTWRTVDLYSLSSTTAALTGADYALYLVHSMAPSTRLNQGSFEDTDLLLADNFSRAAENCGLKQIVFLGGIIPDVDPETLSRHLRSRLETEQTLGSRTTPVTNLRAGIVIGPGGSSFRIIQNLVQRLPVMACPKWCLSPSQPIDINQMLAIIHQSLGNSQVYNQSIEVGGEEVLSYMDLLKKTARLMGKKRPIFSIPFFTLGLSKLWVGVFSNSSTTFVSPLVESLKHDMTVKQDTHRMFKIPVITTDDSINRALKDEMPRLHRKKTLQTEKNTVRSVQRISNPAQKKVAWIATTYMSWLPKKFRYIVRARENNQAVTFRLMGISLLKLQFQPDHSDDKRQLFFIVGGKLAKRTDHGWLEFRSVMDNRFVITAIHEFVPALPWAVYTSTQAIMHLWVMRQFDRFISRT